MEQPMCARFIIFWIAGTLALASAAHAQVTIDVSKITCDQFTAFAVADPRDIAIWLSGYYHGKNDNPILESQQFKANYEKLKSACFNPENRQLPVLQVIEKLFGKNK
jgi:acid stress chaperone HdeB